LQIGDSKNKKNLTTRIDNKTLEGMSPITVATTYTSDEGVPTRSKRKDGKSRDRPEGTLQEAECSNPEKKYTLCGQKNEITRIFGQDPQMERREHIRQMVSEM